VITVYTKPNCVQCEWTKKLMDKLDIEYKAVDVTQDKDAEETVISLGYTALPVVVVDMNTHWQGFRMERIKGLKRSGRH